MNHKILLCLFALPIATISAMETISNDIIIYHISPRLNRFTKNSYKLINKKFSELIIPQDILNAKYKLANKEDDSAMMLEWRKKGALHIHEEVYNIFIENKKLSAKMLWFNYTNTPEPFCVTTAFSHGIKMNNKPFITFLLDEAQPSYDSDIIKSAIVNSTILKCHEIINALEQYITQNKKPKNLCRCGNEGYCVSQINKFAPQESR